MPSIIGKDRFGAWRRAARIELLFLQLTYYGLIRRVPAQRGNDLVPWLLSLHMPRPKHEHPTPAELEVLRILWQRNPLSVREVMDVLNRRRPRAYTSVMSLLGVMTDKGLLARKPRGRAFVYAPKAGQKKTMRRMLADLLGRAFEGSASLMVAHLLEEANPTADEMAQIREAIAQYEQDQDPTS
jgi:predicted transcriptional regulator